MMWLFVVALLQPPQPVRVPVEAAYIEHPDFTILRGGGQIPAALGLWRRSGAARVRSHELRGEVMRPCIPTDALRSVDAACVRRVLPASVDGVPVVAIIPRGTGRDIPMMNVTCVGRDGVGTAQLDLHRGGTASHIADEGLEMRRRVSLCLNAALRGSVNFVPGEESIVRPELIPPERSFNGSSGPGLWIYHMQMANCDQLTYHIGRNGVSGRWTMPLSSMTWRVVETGAPNRANVVLSCTDGSSCITYRRNRVTQQLSSKAVPFAGSGLARSFADRLTRLRRTCTAKP